MAIAYALGLLAALFLGAGFGWLMACLRFEQIATREREYEAELAEAQELYAASALLHRMRINRFIGDE